MHSLVYVVDKVVRGFGRGSKTLGCPTANVDNISHLSMPTGIYCGLVQLVIKRADQIQAEPGYEKLAEKIKENLPYVSPVRGMVCSYGYNPQFGNQSKTLEVHVLDEMNFNFYGAEIRALICTKMRDEKKYNSMEELKEAMAIDIKQPGKEVTNYEHLAKVRDYFLDV